MSIGDNIAYFKTVKWRQIFGKECCPTVSAMTQCVQSHVYIPVLWAYLSAPIPRRFKNQSLGFLDLILRCEQIEHYLLFWTSFAWVTPREMFQVLPSTSFESIQIPFTIARTWKQPRCLLAEEWIRKLWYTYTMEYYSAIKKNAFESVLMGWMKLEPIIQSEVSQKEKH